MRTPVPTVIARWRTQLRVVAIVSVLASLASGSVAYGLWSVELALPSPSLTVAAP